MVGQGLSDVGTSRGNRGRRSRWDKSHDIGSGAEGLAFHFSGRVQAKSACLCDFGQKKGTFISPLFKRRFL